MDLLDRLLGHDEWATRTLLDVSAGLTDDQLDQRFDVGHETLRATYTHLIGNIAGWTAGITQQPMIEPSGELSIAGLTGWYEPVYAKFATTARRLRDDAKLDETQTDDYGAKISAGGAILHVIVHSEGHRAEALHILSRLGVPDLPELDLALWDIKRNMGELA